MLREIVLDTETTGLDPNTGDRLIEIGCLELVNRIPSGREFHCFINPENRAVHPDAEAIHGISAAFLEDKPPFSAVADEFLAFLGDAALVIHNASFDMGFINMELDRAGRPAIPMERVIDTLALARRKHPAGPNSLDALCKRYGIDNSRRVKHGALMDSELLAEVYVELLGERQAALVLGEDRISARGARAHRASSARPRPTPLTPRLTPEAEALHRAFVETLGEDAIWRRYMAAAREKADETS